MRLNYSTTFSLQYVVTSAGNPSIRDVITQALLMALREAMRAKIPYLLLVLLMLRKHPNALLRSILMNAMSMHNTLSGRLGWSILRQARFSDHGLALRLQRQARNRRLKVIVLMKTVPLMLGQWAQVARTLRNLQCHGAPE
jgi:hypothetical protein